MPAPALPRDQPPLLGPGQRSRGPVARPGRGAAAVSWHRAAAIQAELPENDCDQEEWCDDKHLNRIVSGGEYSFTVCPPSLPSGHDGPAHQNGSRDPVSPTNALPRGTTT